MKKPLVGGYKPATNNRFYFLFFFQPFSAGVLPPTPIANHTKTTSRFTSSTSKIQI
jgi:hypothetical protein